MTRTGALKERRSMKNIASVVFLTAMLAAPAGAAFTLTRVAPRIFTPGEGSTAVNRARFTFANPEGAEVTIRIFDVTGALVRRNLDSESATVKYWDGRDQGGSQVRAGIYIYQIEVGEEVLTGTVVVAK